MKKIIIIFSVFSFMSFAPHSSSFKTTESENFQEPKEILIHGVAIKQTITGNSNEIIHISGTDNEIKIIGSCHEIKIDGVDNVVHVDQVNLINIEGTDNVVRYKKSNNKNNIAKTKVSGVDNVIEKIK